MQQLPRSKRALLAANLLAQNCLFEDCVSRAYYAVLHAAKAALLLVEVQSTTHVGVKKMFGLHLVRTGKIEHEFAKILAREQEDRELGDYEAAFHMTEERACARVVEAEKFVNRIERFLQAFAPNRQE